MEQQEEGRNDTSDTKKPEPMSYIDTMIRVNSIIQFRTSRLLSMLTWELMFFVQSNQDFWLLDRWFKSLYEEDWLICLKTNQIHLSNFNFIWYYIDEEY